MMATLSSPILHTPAGSLGFRLSPEAVESELPSALAGPLVWTGQDYVSESFILHLNRDDIEELDTALRHFKELHLCEELISPETFPLARLRGRLRDASTQIHEGRGFVVLKGLHDAHYDVEDSVKIFLGISSYIADMRGQQDSKGKMLSHITSSKSWTVPMDQRHGIHSDSALPFHNDMGCDILALQARHVAEKGGLTYLSSAWAVFNRLLLHEPDVVETLMNPNWPVQISGRETRYFLAPAFTIHEGKLMTSMDPNRFGPHPSFTGPNKPPSLTSAQKHALERVSAVAHEFELSLRLEQGDLLFFNNWALLHRRDSYKDAGETSRHLVRLWLRDTRAGWSVPDSMRQPWAAAYEPEIPVVPTYALHATKEYKKPKYTAGSAAFIIEDPDEVTGAHEHN